MTTLGCPNHKLPCKCIPDKTIAHKSTGTPIMPYETISEDLAFYWQKFDDIDVLLVDAVKNNEIDKIKGLLRKMRKFSSKYWEYAIKAKARNSSLQANANALYEQYNLSIANVFILAARNGNTSITDILVNKCYNPSWNSGSNHIVFVEAAENNYLHVIKYLIRCGYNPFEYIGNYNALINAAGYGNIEVVKFLVEYGFDCRYRGDLALHYAITNSRLDVVKYLIEKGCDLRRDIRSLQFIVFDYDLEALKYFQEQGYDLRKIDFEVICSAKIEVIKFVANLQPDSDKCSNPSDTCIVDKYAWSVLNCIKNKLIAPYNVLGATLCNVFSAPETIYLFSILTKNDQNKFLASVTYTHLSWTKSVLVQIGKGTVNKPLRNLTQILKFTLKPKSLRMQMILIA
jgi:hypothetical protein